MLIPSPNHSFISLTTSNPNSSCKNPSSFCFQLPNLNRIPQSMPTRNKSPYLRAALITNPDDFQVGRLVGSYGFMNITSYSSFQSGGLSSAATFDKSLGYLSEDIERLRVQDVGEGQVKIRLYEGRVVQGPLKGTRIVFKVYPGQRAGGAEADMMAANELNAHASLQSDFKGICQNLQILLGGFETSLKFFCYDRVGLLHDVTQVLCELELTIKRVKVSTTPDGRVMDLFFITDTRELLHTKKRKEETCEHLRAVLGDSTTSFDIEPAPGDIAAFLQASPFLPPEINEDMFNLELPNDEEKPTGSQPASTTLSVTMDNSLSPAHSLIQIFCRDHKGLLYDVMRTLKDYKIQISYGRFYASHKGHCDLDLFVVQMDGKKIVDPNKQKALCDRLRMELYSPLRVHVLNRGPDTELLVANPVELSNKGRPLVFYDITLALKLLHSRIFVAEICRHVIGDREWEVYRVILGDDNELSNSRTAIVDRVTNMLMGWE